jgi:predicted anti-sigma-YlaC factor YlaD
MRRDSACKEESLSLLAAGALPPQDRARLERHLANCAGCRKYYDEIKDVAGLLANSGKAFAGLEPGESAQQRWDKDFEAATRQRQLMRAAVFHWCRDIVRPFRWVWAGMAAIWLGLFAVNFRAQEASRTMASSRPPPELVKAFLVSEGFWGADENRAANRPGSRTQTQGGHHS